MILVLYPGQDDGTRVACVKFGGKEFLCSVQRLMPLEIGDERTKVESSVDNDSSLNTSTASARPMPEIRFTKPTDSSTQLLDWTSENCHCVLVGSI